MPKTVQPAKRKYDSTRRQEQARRTRTGIALAARQLFLQRGYAGATIEAIAEEAGVAKETVYAIFKNKQRILAYVLDIAIGGDEQPVRVMDRPEPQAVLHDTDQHRQLRGFAQGITIIQSRAAPLLEVTRIAAKTEPEIARRLKRLYAWRLENMTRVARHVAANGPLRDGMRTERAAEILWGLSSADLYLLMTQYQGWSMQEFAEWLGETLERLLLP